MKRKVLIFTIILTSISLLFFSGKKVQAVTGELDPKNYILFPITIFVNNKVATATVSVSSIASGYNISYQKIDLTNEKFDSIKEKFNKEDSYIETVNKNLKEKETNLDTLKKKYEDLQQDDTATEKEISTAKTNYENAYKEYTEYYDSSKKEIEKLHTEYLEQIPNYTNSWKKTTNTSSNIELDFSNYSGMIHFILWVKIDNGTNTYYNFRCYSTEIKQETKEDTKQTKDEDTTTKTTTEKSETTTGKEEWTDFSKAKYDLKKDGISKAILEISNVTPKENHNYYLYITSNSSKTSINDIDENNKILLTYDKESKTFKSLDYKLSKYVELNQDLYATVLEEKGYLSNISTYGNKLERYSESKYNDAFYATFITSKSDQIVTNFTHEKSNNRKMQIKVGKITDIDILKKIKNKDTTGLSSLMTFAKSNTGLFDQTLDADKDDSYAIEYNAGTGKSKDNKLIDLKGLQNEEYYYLYVKTSDENKKYISNEAVTLAKAGVYENGTWYLFFYGSSDFKWSEFETTTVDNTTKPGKLPQTGVEYVMYCIVIFVTAVSGFIAYKKYKKI